MNEAETRAELIDPKLTELGWGDIEDSKVLRERDVCKITDGRIQTGGKRSNPMIADYILVHKGVKLAVIEAKSSKLDVAEGVMQAKEYAAKLQLKFTYAANGKEIYKINMDTGEEGLVDKFPTPLELWNDTFPEQSDWREKFSAIPFEDKGGSWKPRYYQEIAVRNTLEAISNKKDRILLTLATGTGKTAIAFQIAWKLFHSRWTLSRDGKRRPRILFLADRNVLANQAFNSFSSFPEDALVRISPKEIRKKGKVPTNGSIFFTIFQSFMTGSDKDGNPTPSFGQYPKDYFDLIIIDECHRGGANDESNWRDILDYFSPAVQLGLTATPKRKDNVDTYDYFGKPVYIYSLKEGINDGFLTPFKVKRIQTTLDDYVYTSDDEILDGEIEEGKRYEESDFNKVIEIKAREEKRVRIFLEQVNQNEKTIIFCANQTHAAAIRDLVNQIKTASTDAHYCVRVTANDGERGEQYLRTFQDNEKLIPTMLTTSQKLSTGVDARNVRNIVLLRPVTQIIEFKQIVGRGTRLFDGKEFFTIYDFVDASQRFSDPEWDGEPIEEENCLKCEQKPCVCDPTEKKLCKHCGERPCICEKPPVEDCTKCNQKPCVCKRKIKIKLRDGKEREIQHMTSTSYWSADGKPISASEFLQNLYGELPKLFKNEDELRKIWGNPMTRKTLLDQLSEAGFSHNELKSIQSLINAEKSDLFDVLEYVAFAVSPITREARASGAEKNIFALINSKQKEFLEFVLSKYIESGETELSEDKLPDLLTLKYHALADAKEALGEISGIRSMFIDFQKYLYEQESA